MIRTYYFFYLMLSGIVFTIFACSPVEVVSTNKFANVDYTAYKTFNFLDVSFKNDSLADTNTQEIQFLKNAIVQEMEAIGYKQSSDPDLWVNIGIMVEQKVQTRQTDIREAPRYIGQRRYSWQSEEVVVNRYKEGTVMVDVIDAARFERIWEGVASGTLSSDMEKLESRIGEAIRRLFEKYPVSAEN